MKCVFQRFLAAALLFFTLHSVLAQQGQQDIYASNTLWQQRTALEKDLRERIIGHNLSLPLDSNSEDRYLSACEAISQFLLTAPEVEKGFARLFAGYDSLTDDTKRAFLEAVYAIGTTRYAGDIQRILEKEQDPKRFAQCAVYLYRCDTTTLHCNDLKIAMAERFPNYDSLPILQELTNYLSYHSIRRRGKIPAFSQLLAWQRQTGRKIIYTFQRWNRDYPGLAIVQNADGSLVRGEGGKVKIFRQLARSGSDLPYFITDGSTPQGIYSIQGLDISRTPFIGPTPNLQLIMPFEDSWEHYFHQDSLTTLSGPPAVVSSSSSPNTPHPIPDSLQQYLALLPPSWRSYSPMMEAWSAGHIGRTAIIAHGTTIDPGYFKDRPFYPLTPTMGCLCAEEEWNPTSGHLLLSEQYELISAFRSTPGNTGYLFVINIDDQDQPVTRAEVENLLRQGQP